MARPPGPRQKRYRGRIRASMRSALNHLNRLVAWDTKYRAQPIDTYPNQLGVLFEINTITQASLQLQLWLAARGPIPSR
jgi:hypothetical protein